MGRLRQVAPPALTRRAGALAAALLVVGTACVPSRADTSPLELLLRALPRPMETAAYSLSYKDLSTAGRWSALREPPDEQSLTDGTWTAARGQYSSPVPGRVFAGDRGHQIRLSGPSLATIDWLTDTARSAASVPGLRDMARVLGEPSVAGVSAAPPGCRAKWLAYAENQAVSPTVVAAVLLDVGPEAPARAADLVVQLRPRLPQIVGPGVTAGIDRRGGAVVLAAQGVPPFDPREVFCGN